MSNRQRLHPKTDMWKSVIGIRKLINAQCCLLMVLLRLKNVILN